MKYKEVNWTDGSNMTYLPMTSKQENKKKKHFFFHN